MGLKEARQLRLEDKGWALVPKNMVCPAEFLFLGHLGRQDRPGGRVVQPAPLAKTPEAGRQSGGDQQVAFLPEVERVLKEQRNVRHEQGRRKFAGGSQRFKTFLAHPGMEHCLEILACRIVAEHQAPQDRPVDPAGFVDDPIPEACDDRGHGGGVGG